jgi:hypothetical protein
LKEKETEAGLFPPEHIRSLRKKFLLRYTLLEKPGWH